MAIQLDDEVYQRLKVCPWFAHCGEPEVPDFRFAVQRILEAKTATISVKSDSWCDAKTRAQGELTGYLSRQDYNTYGTHWNKLARQTETLDKTIASQVADSLELHGLERGLTSVVLVDIGRAALELSFRKEFRKAPVFFERLLQVYEAGRLPCGWDGDLENWPEGALVVF